MAAFNDLNMNILIISANEGFGFVHVDKLIPSLKKMGCSITVMGWDREKILPKKFVRGNVLHHMICRGWGYANKRLFIGIPVWMLLLTIQLVFLQKKYSVIMAIDFDSALPVALTKKIVRIPFIYNIRDNFAMRTTIPKSIKLLISKLDSWVVKKANKIIVPDENRITTKEKEITEKYSIIYNCALDIKPGLPEVKDRPFTIYAMGYLLKIRGIDILLDAAKHLPDVHFLFAGKVYENDVKQKIENTPNADFRGWLSPEEALRLCFQSDVIYAFYDPISEINRKAASNKWSDAMMASKPLLVNSEMQKSNWIAKQDIGYLCPYGDVNKLVETITLIRINPKAANKKGKNGRKLYESGFSWEAMEMKIYNLLKEINK